MGVITMLYGTYEAAARTAAMLNGTPGHTPAYIYRTGDGRFTIISHWGKPHTVLFHHVDGTVLTPAPGDA